MLALYLLQFNFTFKSIIEKRVTSFFWGEWAWTPTRLFIKSKLYCLRFDQFICFSPFVLQKLFKCVKCYLLQHFHMSEDALGYSVWDSHMISLISFPEGSNLWIISPPHKSLSDGVVASVPPPPPPPTHCHPEPTVVFFTLISRVSSQVWVHHGVLLFVIKSLEEIFYF